MKQAVLAIVVFSTIVFSLGSSAHSHKTCTMKGVATGKVTQVGFRAALLKLAIKYQLGGWAKNDGASAKFVYQGHCSTVYQAIGELYTADAHACVSSITLSKVTNAPTTYTTFTIYGWTSTSRCYNTPTNIVYHIGSGASYKELINQFKPSGGWACDQGKADCDTMDLD